MDVWLLVGLGVAHRDFVGPFYEPICAQDMDPTKQVLSVEYIGSCFTKMYHKAQ